MAARLFGGVAERGTAARLAIDDAAGAEQSPLADIGERNGAEIEMNLIAELFPQIVGETAALIAAAAGRRARGAARRPDRLVDRPNDVRDAGLARRGSPQITAARAAHAAHQAAFAQLGEELFQIGQRD